MSKWAPSLSDVLKTCGHQLDKRFNSVRAGLKRRYGWVSPVKILPYRGLGSASVLYLAGRVIEDKRVGSPKEEDTWWDNIKAMYRRFATDEIAGVRILATIQGQQLEAITDEEGFFQFQIELERPLKSGQLWHSVHLRLLDEVSPDQGLVEAVGEVLIPAPASSFGVISDIDDTIIESHATDALKLARITFLKNARTRTPLPGVSILYRALERGPGSRGQNPFFYVSSSAWNLYDLFVDFLELHDIPAGPIFLRDLSVEKRTFIQSGHEHKLEKIARIMDICRELPFVLLGDAGQDDPVIYREVVRREPDRILAIYIRSVARARHNERAAQIAEQTSGSGVPMLLVQNVDRAFRHAVKAGLVDPSVLAGLPVGDALLR